MIHHYLTTEEIIHLNELHYVKLCKNCKNHRGDMCDTHNKHILDEYRQACDQYKEKQIDGRR